MKNRFSIFRIWAFHIDVIALASPSATSFWRRMKVNLWVTLRAPFVSYTFAFTLSTFISFVFSSAIVVKLSLLCLCLIKKVVTPPNIFVLLWLIMAHCKEGQYAKITCLSLRVQYHELWATWKGKVTTISRLQAFSFVSFYHIEVMLSILITAFSYRLWPFWCFLSFPFSLPSFLPYSLPFYHKEVYTLPPPQFSKPFLQT